MTGDIFNHNVSQKNFPTGSLTEDNPSMNRTNISK